MRYKLAAVLCVQIVLIGFVSADTQELVSSFGFHMDQKVQGDGFSNSYLNARALNFSLSNQEHGSGSYNHESLLGINNQVEYDTEGYYDSSDNRNINLVESADFSYAPTSFCLGGSMKWGGFKSQGKDETCLKNYDSHVSMDALFDHVTTLSKSVSASLYWESTGSLDGSYYAPEEQAVDEHGNSSLDVEAAFTGKGHFGAQMLRNDMHNADILVDEDYFGTYSVSKKMSHEVTYKAETGAGRWLPCCSGGFADMNADDKAYLQSARGVFDCTCFKPISSENRSG